MRLLAAVLGLLLLPLPAAGWENDLAEITISEAGGLSAATLAAAEELAPLVGAEMAVVHSGSLRLLAVTREASDVQRPPPGFGVPMAVAAVDPVEMAPLLGPATSRLLGRGEIVMSQLSAGLRGAQAGDVVALEGWNGAVRELRIGAVLPDERMGWSEILMSTAAAAELGFDRPSRLEIWDHDDVGVTSLVLRFLLPPGPIRVRVPGQEVDTSDATLPTVLVKQRFGEFAFRFLGGDQIEIDQAWVEANIVEVDVGRLGTFRCHRLVVPFVRAALDQIEEMRLAWLIDTEDFQAAGGCYNPRLMRGGDKGFALSRHAWGIAIDINPSTNPYGGPVRLERRIGEAFREWGFAWGAGWAYPDGMHFEWSRLPADLDGPCSDHQLVASDRAGVDWEVYARTDRCTSSQEASQAP